MHIVHASSIANRQEKQCIHFVRPALVHETRTGALGAPPPYHELFFPHPAWSVPFPPSPESSYGPIPARPRANSTALAHDVAPPAYAVDLDDRPPAYTRFETSRRVSDSNVHHHAAEPRIHQHHPFPPSYDAKFDTTSCIRNHVSKKKKQEQKRNQAAKWADSDGDSDGLKNEGDSGGVDGASSGNTGPGGGQGSGDDDKDEKNWQPGGQGRKMNKKGKRSKDQDDDEAEEGDDAQAKPGGNFWDNLMNAEPDPDEEWGTAVGKKKKKSRKGKVS